jgi:hypothetical protein
MRLKTGLELERKDAVMTGKNAQAQMTFLDRTVVTVGSSTVFQIEEYLFDETQARAKFAVADGIFKTVSGKIGKQAPENFSFRTKTAVIGIRGTIFRGKIDETADIILCEEGVISVTSLLSGEVYLLPAGKMIRLPHDGGPIQILDVTPDTLKAMGIEEEFEVPKASSIPEQIGSAEVQSLPGSPISAFETPLSHSESLTPPAGDEALNRHLQTQQEPSLRHE